MPLQILFYEEFAAVFFCFLQVPQMCGGKHEDSPHLMRYSKNVYFIIISSTADRLIRTGGQKMTLEEELRFRRMCPYDAFGDYSDVLKEIRQKEKEKKTDTVSVVNRSK